MSEKSHVGMECKVCPLCGKIFSNGNILIDKQLKNSLERETVTGVQLCEEHLKEDYVALIEIDESKSVIENGKVTQPFNTGRAAHLKDEAFERVFNLDVPSYRFIYVDQEVFNSMFIMEK